MRRPVAIAANDIDKAYGKQSIFKKLSLEINEGQFTVLLGKNGTGKSTFLRLVTGLDPVDTGKMITLGSDVEREDVIRRQQIAFVSEQIAADPDQKLHRILDIYGSLQPNWEFSIFDHFIKVFGLSIEKKFGMLSRGQKVQFFFSLAAASKPKLYLLDEVTSVLDANARFEVMNHLRREVGMGATVILATNIAAEAHNFANEIVLLIDGKVGLRCSVDELQGKFKKFRAPASYIPVAHCRPVQLNRDGSKSYLIPSELNLKLEGELAEDQRGITIEDVFVYFTGPESK